MIDLAKIKAEYINSKTNVSCKSLALENGISFNSLRNVATRENWCGQRKTILQSQTDIMTESIEPTEPTKSVETITELATNKLYNLLRGEEVGANNIKSLTAALKDLHSIQQSTRNNDSEGKLPDIVEALRGVEE